LGHHLAQLPVKGAANLDLCFALVAFSSFFENCALFIFGLSTVTEFLSVVVEGSGMNNHGVSTDTRLLEVRILLHVTPAATWKLRF
jgi:hypothetical protein